MRCTPVLRGLGEPHHWPVSRSPTLPDDARLRAWRRGSGSERRGGVPALVCSPPANNSRLDPWKRAHPPQQNVRGEVERASLAGAPLDTVHRARTQARMTEGGMLKKITEAMKDLVTEANFDCSSTGISLQAMVRIKHACDVTTRRATTR